MSSIAVTTTITLPPRLVGRIIARYETERAVDPTVTIDRVVEAYVLAGLVHESIEREAPAPTKKPRRRASR